MPSPPAGGGPVRGPTGGRGPVGGPSGGTDPDSGTDPVGPIAWVGAPEPAYSGGEPGWPPPGCPDWPPSGPSTWVGPAWYPEYSEGLSG